MDNKMIIIGSSNNYNELGLVRSFGVNGIRPYGIIICKSEKWKHDWLHRSKYWKKCWHVETAQDALEFLVKNFANEIEKPVVTTPVDYIMQMIDADYEEFSKKFIIQTMKKKKNGINNLANKLEQANFTKKLGFKTLPTKIVEIDSFFSKNINEEFPVLLKPVAGGEGSKDDITICNTMKEYCEAIEMFKNKKYKRILCQKYLENRLEIVVYGALSKDADLCSYTIIKNIRQWPLSYGVGSFGEIVTDEKTIEFINKICVAVKDSGYDGPIDIEVFQDNDTNEFYISEYNWRPGGRNFTSLGTGVYSIVLWYWVKTGKKIKEFASANIKSCYTMNDATDINHVINKKISFRQWITDFRKSSCHALWNLHDMRPVFIPYISILKSAIKRK